MYSLPAISLSPSHNTVSAVEFDSTEEYVKEGEALTLSCVYTNNDDYSVINVEWTLDDTSLSGIQ